MRLLHALPGLFSLVALASACGGVVTGPSQQGPLRLTGAITSSVVRAGETATITFKLENLGSDKIELTWSDGCWFQPYIANASGSIVFPEGGQYVCTQVISTVTLQPGGSETRTIQLRAGNTTGPYVGLGAGEYSAYGKLQSYSHKLQSDPVRFTVQ